METTVSGTHVAPIGNVFPIPSQPVFVLSPYCCVLSGEAANTNYKSDLTRPGLESKIYHTLDEQTNHYATNAVRM